MKVKVISFKYKDKKMLEIHFPNGTFTYRENTYSLPLNKNEDYTYSAKYNKKTDTLSNFKLKNKKHMTKKQVRKALSEMDNFSDIFS